MRWKNFSFEKVGGFVLFCIVISASYSMAEKSMWQKFKDFFTPGETIDCEVGPTCDEYKRIDSKINTLEGKYSRERRPVHKRRYKQELDSLTVIRDSLVVVIKGPQVDSAALSSAAIPSVAEPVSSAAQPASSASVSAVSSADVSSSSAVELASSASDAKVLSATEVAALVCKPDTVYVRDTVVVHDTLYVVVTNKPAEVPASSSSSP